MNIVFRQTQLYKFLFLCEEQARTFELEKTILDCGAGGNMPPLGLFSSFGYRTTGIEYSDSQIRLSRGFEERHGVQLNIKKGDMRSLPFEDESFSFVYSFNSIFHMTKLEIDQSIAELKRVLKPNGLMLINLLTHQDEGYGEGTKVGEDEFLQDEHGDQVVHSYHSEKELREILSDMKMIFRENRVTEREIEGEMYRQSYCELIVQK
ncbi:MULTISPECIES: class I SAM-dependent methyltransferase [unclassified Fusibacter]|uniref:class I SAM-dependent methyltransferase n=1 Tax=unclassified Fusibacter TaxID=2624464 RepID=UPI0010111153|nr:MULTISPECIES: class I SAM-dependent methyltransferase [unclassified Fusibacter]MCK8059597.1 class I SAM-dependent methyltransferase [Fusibacter sp. A2]NPE21398.1 class I SAM-dependent methyltransferase [Fusibacter sp. A1]RXV61813.1 class I SAM-dependent methyltransferase [Fusibacter sp. A1]